MFRFMITVEIRHAHTHTQIPTHRHIQISTQIPTHRHIQIYKYISFTSIHPQHAYVYESRMCTLRCTVIYACSSGNMHTLPLSLRVNCVMTELQVFFSFFFRIPLTLSNLFTAVQTIAIGIIFSRNCFWYFRNRAC